MQDAPLIENNRIKLIRDLAYAVEQPCHWFLFISRRLHKGGKVSFDLIRFQRRRDLIGCSRWHITEIELEARNGLATFADRHTLVWENIRTRIGGLIVAGQNIEVVLLFRTGLRLG